MLKFVILATDGLWDFLENKEAVDIVQRCVAEGKPTQASQRLVAVMLAKAAAESHLTLNVRYITCCDWVPMEVCVVTHAYSAVESYCCCYLFV